VISEEVLRQIRRIAIVSRRKAQNVFAGPYHSAFKGKGMEFFDVREYQAGDDPRMIDWNVSSRNGRLFVKRYVEERELTVILAIDMSASLQFFAGRRSKQETAAYLAALVAFASLLNGDKVGLLLFTDRIECYVPPRKGRNHLLRLIREILQFTPSGRGTSLTLALETLNRMLKKKAVIFLVSDFLDEGFETPLKIAARKHDLIAAWIADAGELAPPTRGLFSLRDRETGQDVLIDFGQAEARDDFLAFRAARERRIESLLSRHRVDTVPLFGDIDPDKPLFELFSRRRRKLSR